MPDLEIINPSAGRRRKIGLVMLVPIVAALALWLAESGHWLVVYNDTAELLDEIHLRAGAETWVVHELAPHESRRLRIRATETTELEVAVTGWAPEATFHVPVDGRHTAFTTLRLEVAQTITTTSEGSAWARLRDW